MIAIKVDIIYLKGNIKDIMKNLLFKALFLSLYFLCIPFILQAQYKFYAHGNAYTVTNKGVLFSKGNFEWVMLDSIDLKSFRKFDGYYSHLFAFDKNGTFCHGKQVVRDTVDFKSYECIEYLGELYYKDKDAVYCGVSKIEGADSNTFLVVDKLCR